MFDEWLLEYCIFTMSNMLLSCIIVKGKSVIFLKVTRNLYITGTPKGVQNNNPLALALPQNTPIIRGEESYKMRNICEQVWSLRTAISIIVLQTIY